LLCRIPCLKRFILPLAARAPFLDQFLARHWRRTGGKLGGLWRLRTGKFR
jgi:hypothetical protein